MQKILTFIVIISITSCSNPNRFDDTFKKLQPTLEFAVAASLSKSEDAMYNLERKVSRSGNPSEGLEKIKRTGYLMQKTKHLLSFIDSLKTSLKKIPNTIDKSSVKKIFIAQGMGKILESSLNEYVLWLNEVYKDLENKPSFYSLTQDSLKRDFVKDNFGQATVSEAMIYLANLQIDVLRFSQEILKLFGADEIIHEFCHRRIIALAVAKSNFVMQGEDYEVDMCLAEYDCNSWNTSKLILNGEPLKMYNDDNNVILPNTSEGVKSWEAMVTKRRFRKPDTTFLFQKSYQVFPKNQLDADFLKAYSGSNF